MRKPATLLAATAVALGPASALWAHHSGSAYSTEPVWISGIVIEFEPSNPHTLTHLESRAGDGSVERWVVEGPPQAQLGRVQAIDFYIPQPGDAIGFCAFPYKSREELSALWPDVDYSSSFWATTDEASSPRTVAGNIMFTPDGAKQSWELHGIFAACILSSDEPRQAWADYLNEHAQLRQLYCTQTSYQVVQSDGALREFVAAFNALLDEPCTLLNA
jgi:hypothetical protein